MTIEDLICLCIDLHYEVSIAYKKDGIHISYIRHGQGVYHTGLEKPNKATVVISYEQWHACKDDISYIRRLFATPIRGNFIAYDTFKEIEAKDKNVKWRAFSDQHNKE